jgi:hypothetical protein
MKTVLAVLKEISKNDILNALIAPGRMDGRQRLTTEQWRMLLRKMGATDLEIVRTLREMS